MAKERTVWQAPKTISWIACCSLLPTVNRRAKGRQGAPMCATQALARGHPDAVVGAERDDGAHAQAMQGGDDLAALPIHAIGQDDLPVPSATREDGRDHGGTSSAVHGYRAIWTISPGCAGALFIGLATVFHSGSA